MNKLVFGVFEVSFVILILAVTASDAYRVGNNPYHHREIFGARGRYVLEWLVDWPRERVLFNVTVETRGYVGLGLSRNGRMTGADIVIGGVGPNGRPYFSDRHAVGNQAPIVDRSQDWKLHSAWESATHTSISFSRAFETCDNEQDLPINDDSISILWAFGERDNTTEYHFVNRGSFITYLRDPDNTPASVSINGPFIPGVSQLPHELQKQNVEVWSIRDTFSIPARRTSYWCNIHRLTIPTKHHIIGFKFNINEAILTNMHHMLFYRCITPPGVNVSTVFEPVLNLPGEECYSPAQRLGVIQTQFCYELKLGHAIGGGPLFFPETVGVPVGESNGQPEYFLLQTHYDNPNGRTDLQADVQLDVYHTAKLRPNDGGMISVGHNIPGSPSLLVPPGTVDHRIYGHCSPSCTSRMFPPQGITIVAALLHSHNAGRRITVQQFRNNRELQPISKDDNYMFNHQPIRLFRTPVVIQPGDHVTTRCVYDTSERNTTVVGGYGTDQEMCQVFMVYHTLLRNYPVCRSGIISPEYTRRYLAGTTNLTWNQPALEFAATAPPQVAGMIVSEISDTLVNWNLDLRAQLQRDHESHPQVTACLSVAEAAVVAQTGITPPPQFVSNPLQATPWQSPQKCFNTNSFQNIFSNFGQFTKFKYFQ